MNFPVAFSVCRNRDQFLCTTKKLLPVYNTWFSSQKVSASIIKPSGYSCFLRLVPGASLFVSCLGILLWYFLGIWSKGQWLTALNFVWQIPPLSGCQLAHAHVEGFGAVVGTFRSRQMEENCESLTLWLKSLMGCCWGHCWLQSRCQSCLISCTGTQHVRKTPTAHKMIWGNVWKHVRYMNGYMINTWKK